MPAAPPDIWSHSFLQSTSDSLEDGSDSEVDAGRAEKTELDDLDLGGRDEGDLVVKAANPWTKAKIAAGVREQRKAADCSSSSTTSESTSSTHRRQTPAEPQTSSSDIDPTSSSSSVSETRPRLPARSAISKEAIALSKGTVQGKNGWWRPPASAARTVPPPSARNVKKTRPAASRREEVEVGLSREIIDLTKDIAGESGAKELLNRLRAHSTVAQSLLSETPPLLPLDSDDDDEVTEPSPGSAPSESRGRRFELIPSTTHTHVHNKLHYQSPHPRDASPKPSSKPHISSAANIASSRSLSSPSPSRCQSHSTAQSQSTADHKPSTLPTTSMATSSASRSAPDTRLLLGGDLSHATTTSQEATARVGAKPAQKKSSKGLNDVCGKISFDRIPKNAGPTSDYPILQGLESQKRLRPRRQTSDSHPVKKTKKVVNAGSWALSTTKPVGQAASRPSNHVKEERESSPFRLPAPAMEYLSLVRGLRLRTPSPRSHETRAMTSQSIRSHPCDPLKPDQVPPTTRTHLSKRPPQPLPQPTSIHPSAELHHRSLKGGLPFPPVVSLQAPPESIRQVPTPSAGREGQVGEKPTNLDFGHDILSLPSSPIRRGPSSRPRRGRLVLARIRPVQERRSPSGDRIPPRPLLLRQMTTKTSRCWDR